MSKCLSMQKHDPECILCTAMAATQANGSDHPQCKFDAVTGKDLPPWPRRRP